MKDTKGMGLQKSKDCALFMSMDTNYKQTQTHTHARASAFLPPFD